MGGGWNNNRIVVLAPVTQAWTQLDPCLKELTPSTDWTRPMLSSWKPSTQTLTVRGPTITSSSRPPNSSCWGATVNVFTIRTFTLMHVVELD